jgi:hypothetical protein
MKNFDEVILEKDKAREKYLHDIVINNSDVHKDLKSILNFPEESDMELVHEDRYINGIIADFTVFCDKSVRAIIECKAGDIGVTDYVRGIGQTLQYEYFFEKKISSKGYSFSEDFNSVLLFPSSIVKDKLINIGRFKYPESTIILEFNELSKVTREISKEELEKLGKALDDDVTTISQYYIRDNRLFELYLLLKYLIFLSIKGENNINRKELEENTLRKLETPNNNNWRNAFISLSSLGFINSDNMPTPAGFRMGSMDYENFLLMMYKSYISPYVDVILNYFKDDSENLNKKNSLICDDLRKDYSNRDVLFLTQSDSRYLSSWLSILRDDFGCLEFESRSCNREMIYDVSELNEKALLEKIKNHTRAGEYLKKLTILTSN